MSRSVLVAAMLCLLLDAMPGHAQFGGPIRPVGGSGFLYGAVPYSRAPFFRVRGLVLGLGPRIPLATLTGLPLLPVPFTPLGINIYVTPGAVLVPTRGVILPAPLSINPGEQRVPEARQPMKPPATEDDAPPRVKLEDHIVIRPKKALPQLPPPEPVPVAKREAVAPAKREEARPEIRAKPRPPIADTDPFAVRKPITVEQADADPVKEMARLVKLGKVAFAAGEYGAASERFERASAVDRKKALPLFLKAQAAFAAGRYSDAVAAIRNGLELDSTWPASPFDPRELYGADVTPFDGQLAELRAAIAANPREATLEFLVGYELWFVGEKAEARKWFGEAEKHLLAPGILALFR